MLTPDQIDAIRNSFSAVRPHADAMADEFYDELFRLDPNTRLMFRSDLADQKKKLMATLSVVVNSIDRLHDIIGIVKSLGMRHAGYGVEPSHFASVGLALIHAIDNTLTEHTLERIDEQGREAWFEAFQVLASVMQEGMAEARAS